MALSSDWLRKGKVLIPPGVALSFQRFAWPAGGIVDRAPSSLGCLPVGIGVSGELLLPLAREECFWIGLSLECKPRQPVLSVAVELRNGQILDALSGRVWDKNHPGVAAIINTPTLEGIHLLTGRLRVFSRESSDAIDMDCLRLLMMVTAENSTAEHFFLRLVDYQTFVNETHVSPPPPLNSRAGYKGWLLP